MNSSLYSDGAPPGADDEGEVQQPQLPQQQHAQPPLPPPEPRHSMPAAAAAGLFVNVQPHLPSPAMGAAAAPFPPLQPQLAALPASSAAGAFRLASGSAPQPPSSPQQHRHVGSLLDQLMGLTGQAVAAAHPAAPVRRRHLPPSPQQGPADSASGRPRLMFRPVQRSTAAGAAADAAPEQPGQTAQQAGLGLPSMLEMILGRPLPQLAAEPEEQPAAAAAWPADFPAPPAEAEPAGQAVGPSKDTVELPAQAAANGHPFHWKQRRTPQPELQPQQQRHPQQPRGLHGPAHRPDLQSPQLPPMLRQEVLQQAFPQQDGRVHVHARAPAGAQAALRLPPEQPVQPQPRCQMAVPPPLAQQQQPPQQLQQQQQRSRSAAQVAPASATQVAQQSVAMGPVACEEQPRPAADLPPSQGTTAAAAGAGVSAAGPPSRAAPAPAALGGAEPPAASQPAAQGAAFREAAEGAGAPVAGPASQQGGGAAASPAADASPPPLGLDRYLPADLLPPFHE